MAPWRQSHCSVAPQPFSPTIQASFPVARRHDDLIVRGIAPGRPADSPPELSTLPPALRSAGLSLGATITAIKPARPITTTAIVKSAWRLSQLALGSGSGEADTAVALGRTTGG